MSSCSSGETGQETSPISSPTNSTPRAGRSSSSSLLQRWQPHIVRDLTLVALIFMILSVYRSHKSLHEQFVEFANAVTSSNELPFLMPILPSSSSFINATANKNTHSSNKKTTTIAYCISLTSCGGKSASLDGAAVLRYSIQRLDNERYDSHFYAFVHPNAANCSLQLQQIGYRTKILPTPVNTSDIKGNLKNYVERASCCGSAEFLKLYTYTLTQYPVAVHLDMDVILLKPMYDLYDAMILPDGVTATARTAVLEHIPAMWIRTNASAYPPQIDAFFTRDYNMLSYAGYRKPHETAMQGGFLVVRPNTTVFDEFSAIILEGKYDVGNGWGGNGLRFGGTYGSAQIQGLVAYYYGHVHPHSAVELNRCIYNTMVDSPYDSKAKKCLAPRPEDDTCEDCRKTHISEVVSTHFTLCQKPWWCPTVDGLCYETHKAWFQIRWELELQRRQQDMSYNMSAVVPTRTQNSQADKPWVVANGNWSFCGPNGYIPMNLPALQE